MVTFEYTPPEDDNEDRVYVDEDAGVFLVVDGLGGHAAGEKAAETAVQTIAEHLAASDRPVADRVRFAIAAANNSRLSAKCL